MLSEDRSRNPDRCVYFGCCILDCLAMAGFLLKALSWVGVTAVAIFLDRSFPWSGKVGAATWATICAWSMGSPKMSLGNEAEDSADVCRGFFETRTPCFETDDKYAKYSTSMHIPTGHRTATRTAFPIVFFISAFSIAFCSWAKRIVQ
jgi:hypothetical protein